MKQFEIILTATSQKIIPIQASDCDAALKLVHDIMTRSHLLDFTDTDVETMDIACKEACGGVCEVCGNACDFCGRCTDLDLGCTAPEQDCDHRCPVCGGCLHENDTGNDCKNDSCFSR